MAEFSFPWTASSGDRTVTSEQQRAMYHSLAENGVTRALAGSVATTTLSITDGAVLIEGAYYDVGGSTVAISLAGVVGSLARIMARYDLTARTISLVVTEVDPVRAGGVWELPLGHCTYSGGVWSQPAWTYEWAAVAGAVPVAAVQVFATAAAPAGWLAANGAAVSRTTYARLFAAIGTTFGAGDGITTFALPNLNGRVIVGKDTTQSEFNALGKTGGAKTHVLTQAELPNDANFRGVDANTSASGSGIYYGTTNARLAFANGGSIGHNNLQPYMALLACIKA